MNRKTVRRSIGLLLGAIVVGLLTWRMPWREALSAFRTANPAWWAVAVAVGGLGIVIRTYRLRLILGKQVPVRIVWRALALGYAGGLVFPAGGGELVKFGVLSREGGQGIARTATAITIDRLMDVAGLAAGIMVLSQLQSLPHPMGLVLRVLGWVFLLLGVFLVMLLFRGHILLKWLEQPAGDANLRRRLGRGLGPLLEALDHFRNPRFWVRLALLQACALMVDATGSRLLMEALPMGHLPLWAGLQVGCLVQMAFALPLLPGAIGTHQAACILALRPFGISLSLALAYSFLGYLGHVFTVVGNGIAAAFIGQKLTKPRVSGPS